MKGGRMSNVKIKSIEDGLFHVEYLGFRVGSVRDVDKVVTFRGVNLLIFGGNEHRGNTYELESVAGNMFERQKAIYNGDAEKKGFGEEFKHAMNFYEPVH
jgi:hypothetical protein